MSRAISPVFSLVLAGLILTASQPVQACKCVLPTVQSAREDASALFEGRVLAITDLGVDASATNGELKATLAVVRTWKGLDRDERIDVFTNGSGAACGYTFAKDVSYLVYAREHEGRLYVSACSRTRPLADASEDLQALGGGWTPVAIGPQSKSLDAAVPEPASTTDASPQAIPPNPSASRCTIGAHGPERSIDGYLLTLTALTLLTRSRRRV